MKILRSYFRVIFQITPDGASAIAELGKGDLRRVLNLLQCASRLTEGEKDARITEDDVYAFAAEPIRAHVAEIVQALLTLPYLEAYRKVQDISKKHHYSMKSLVDVMYLLSLLRQ